MARLKIEKALGGRLSLASRAMAALSLCVAACGGSGDAVALDTKEAVTSTNLPNPFFPTAPISSEDWLGSQYSVMFQSPGGANRCSGQLLNSHYAITAGHCYGPPNTLTLEIYRAGPKFTTSAGYVANGQKIWTGTVKVHEPPNAAQNSTQDFSVLELVDAVGVDTCQGDAVDCITNHKTKPINGRLAASERRLYGDPSMDGLTIFGWGKGQNLGPTDLGYSGIQRVGALAMGGYGGAGNTTIDPQTGAPLVPTPLRYFNFNGADGFATCVGDSGSALLGDIGSDILVTYGVVKTAVGPTECQNGGVSWNKGYSAHAFSGFSVGQLIFEIERGKGFTNPANPASGRFHCGLELRTDPRGDSNLFMRCDNDGTAVPHWDLYFMSY